MNERSLQDHTERGITQIKSRIPYYRENIVPDTQALELDGYDPGVWNVERGQVMKFENNLFIMSRDRRTIAGFQLGRDAQGETVSKLDMTQYPQILSVLKDKFGIPPTPPIQRAENVRRAEEQRRPEARIDGSIESVLTVLQSMSVESGGQRLPVIWPTATELSHYLRTNGVPVARYAQYVANMREHAGLLSTELRSSSFRGQVSFDGRRFIATDGRTTLETTATRVLVKKGSGFTTLRGERVTVTENTTTTQYEVGGRTEIHRRDGGIQMSKEGGTIRYYDGSNTRPLIEKTDNDVRVHGPYGSVGLYSGGDPEAYGREIAEKLRTPEAIGAFVSQFYHGQDYRTRSEYAVWMQNMRRPEGNPVRYTEDVGGDHAQNWKATLERGAGDCEDFALLAEALLRQIGIHSLTMMVNPEHYETAYFEHAPGGGYYACTVGLHGFIRSKAFPTRGKAVETLWQARGNGAQFALQNPSVRAQFVRPGDPNSYPENSPGIFVRLQPGEQRETTAMIQYSEEDELANYMRT